jgi:hypothetical protein
MKEWVQTNVANHRRYAYDALKRNGLGYAKYRMSSIWNGPLYSREKKLIEQYIASRFHVSTQIRMATEQANAHNNDNVRQNAASRGPRIYCCEDRRTPSSSLVRITRGGMPTATSLSDVEIAKEGSGCRCQKVSQ